MSLLSTLSQKVSGTPLQLSLATGLISSSYFLFGNVAAAWIGVIPAILDKNGPHIPTFTKVELWKWSYDRAKLHFGISGILSSIAFASASLNAPNVSIRNLLRAAATCSLLVAPYTLAIMMPTNNKLIAMVDQKQFSKATSTDGARLEEQALRDLQKWKVMHRTRLALGTIAWISGAAAFVLCL